MNLGQRIKKKLNQKHKTEQRRLQRNGEEVRVSNSDFPFPISFSFSDLPFHGGAGEEAIPAALQRASHHRILSQLIGIFIDFVLEFFRVLFGGVSRKCDKKEIGTEFS